jgi:copper chaperone CopZ
MHRYWLTFTLLLMMAPQAMAASARFDVQGMVCESCAEDIKASLSKLKGIQSISVDLDKAQVFVTYDQQKANPELIIKAIDGYGFEAKLIRNPSKPTKGQP